MCLWEWIEPTKIHRLEKADAITAYKVMQPYSSLFHVDNPYSSLFHVDKVDNDDPAGWIGLYYGRSRPMIEGRWRKATLGPRADRDLLRTPWGGDVGFFALATRGSADRYLGYRRMTYGKLVTVKVELAGVVIEYNKSEYKTLYGRLPQEPNGFRAEHMRVIGRA